MKEENRTSVTEFFLLGLTDNQKLQIPLFVFFLLAYIITLFGNFSIITLIMMSPHLKTPMYFLLGNLSFVDLCYSSVVTPNMLVNLLSIKKTISVLACATQLFSISSTGSTELFLLVVMAYDRYVAICNPLLYITIMTKTFCTSLVAGSYVLGIVHALIHTTATFQLSFCGSNMIIHFYCDPPPLLKLSCSDTTINEALIIYVGGGLIMGSFSCILISYIYIVSTILKINSTEGKIVAFSTCSSHFVCVTLCFGTLIFMYVRPTSKYSMDQDRVASVIYIVLIPMMNPLIYSLRNRDVKKALRNVLPQIKGKISQGHLQSITS